MKKLFLTILFILNIYQINSQNVFSFGLGNLGQLGDGTTNQQNNPVRVLVGNSTTNPGTPLLAKAAGCGSIHSAVYLDDGGLYTFGFNNLGQIGNTLQENKVYNTPTKITLDPSVKVKLIRGAVNHFTVMLSEDNKLWSFGFDTNGQLGTGTPGIGRGLPPTAVIISNLQGETILDLAVGNEHSVVLTTVGKVYAWGRNANGEVGDGTTAVRSQPTFIAMPNQEFIIAISTFHQHTLALARTEKVLSWGVGNEGQLGSGDVKNILTPTPIKLSSDIQFALITHIAAGERHSVIYDKYAHKFFSFGNNQFGVFGDNTIVSKNEATLGPNLAARLGTERVLKMVAGRDNTFILTTPNARLYVFGRNDNGQLGDGSVVSTLQGESVRTNGVLNGKTIIDVEACRTHTLVVTSGSKNLVLSVGLLIISFLFAF